jgi:hypothetical protein
LPELLLFLLLFSYTPTAAAQASGTFTPTGNMITARIYHTATLLLNGKVLITGGADSTHPGSPVLSAELFDPTTGTFTATGNMTTRQIFASATLLADGRVLITGGRVLDDGTGAFANLLGVAELYDPSTGTFTATGNMARPQAGNTSALLNSGKVLISGTCQDWFYIDADAEGDRPELYDPVTGTFSPAGERAKNPRWCSGPLILLANGQVLVAGTAELYDPATDTFNPTGRRMTTGFYESTATLLASGKVLVAGGSGDFGYSANGELYDPSTGKFTAAGNMIRARAGHTATLLRDGTILIAGGRVSASSAELYDPGIAKFVSTGDMYVPRAGHTATLLLDGRVLMAGGTTADFPSAQLYVPSVLPDQSVVSDLRFDQTSVVAGSSYSLSVSGSNLTSETFLDVRFVSPGSNTYDVVLNWQRGIVASHDVAPGTPPGIWTIIGVRAHDIETDHTGSFSPVSATIAVSP